MEADTAEIFELLSSVCTLHDLHKYQHGDGKGINTLSTNRRKESFASMGNENLSLNPLAQFLLLLPVHIQTYLHSPKC